uniref:Uncharacterized protein n=1 Tax=Panagrolaimus superbus TaxID=310955 RepID=A0A914YK75_9BILA
MGRISNYRRKLKDAAARQILMKSIGKNDSNMKNARENCVETTDATTNVLLKGKKVKKSSVKRKSVVLTRQQQAILNIKEKQKEEKRHRVQKAIDNHTENRKKAKESSKRRREINEKINLKIKNKKLEEKNNELNELLEHSTEPATTETSSSSSEPFIIREEEVMGFKGSIISPKLNAEASTKLKNIIGLSNRKYELLSKQDGINIASISTVKRIESKIFDTYYKNSNGPDFYGLLEAAVNKHDFSNLPYIRITICGDKVKKLICIHTFVGDESREMLEAAMAKIDDDILKLLENGIPTKSGIKKLIFTYVGDCKYLCTSLGLQGGSATCACVNCTAKRSDWITLKREDIVLRTIESIVSNAFEVVNNNSLPRSNSSVKNYPLLRNVPISNFVPPPVHILITMANSIIEFIRKFADDSNPLEEFLKATGVRLHYPAQSYEGNQCRKIMNQFRDDNGKRILYKGFGSNLFEAASQIESFAVARTLTDDEINGLESSIHLFFNLMKNYGDAVVKFFCNKNKIHTLQHHVVPFVRVFKSWGLFSEESGESIHHVRNELDRRVPGIGQKYDEKRNNHFKKTQAVGFHLS